jgi:small subunit ribosomal protein S17
VDASDYQKEIADIEHDLEERKKRRQSMVGVVVSDKNSKSVTVKVEHPRFFPKYNKYINYSKKFMAHDEQEVCDMGDLIRIVPCRPRSKMKRHEVIDVIRKAPNFDDIKVIADHQA